MALRPTAGPELHGLGCFLLSPNFEDDRQELRVNWAPDFGGAERFWSDKDAIAMIGAEPEEVLETCDWISELEFLVMNPDHFEDVGGGFLTPPRATPGNAPPILEASTRTPYCFSKLPEELLFQIMFLLPTASVNAVRLASRAMAAVHLAKIYWQSRFEYPNELSHIKLPSALWAGHTDGLPVDWKKFCHRLLNPESMDWKDDIFWRADMFAMDRYIQCAENRRRITNLSRDLFGRVAQESRDNC